MRIHAISDTHGFHRELYSFKEDYQDIDMLLYGGDSTNKKDLIYNIIEFEDFYNWLINLNIKHKIIIAGNHDAWATKKYNIDKLREAGIIYLENEICEINNIKILGSPYTPNFRDWYFMKDRSKFDKLWSILLEPNIDILLTHGPPKGILDLSHDKQHVLEYCGDKALFNHVMRTKPKYHIFGHIHNSDDCYNQGIRIYNDITFMNVSSVYDGRFDKGLISKGIKFEINK
jgi:Icc-related predicted phosphoesterase